MGVDLGVHKIAIALLDDDTLINVYPYEAPTALFRDMQLRELGSLAHNLAELHAADAVWIEDVIVGNNRKYSIGLAQTMGAVLAHLSALRLGQGTDIRAVDNKVWKKELLGNGNATKFDVRNYIVDTHPAYAPMCGDDQDLYDAACVGLYGRRIMERAEHLQL
jgi:Holliday junction resolvasome RuvABC endonuclease subunit